MLAEQLKQMVKFEFEDRGIEINSVTLCNNRHFGFLLERKHNDTFTTNKEIAYKIVNSLLIDLSNLGIDIDEDKIVFSDLKLSVSNNLQHEVIMFQITISTPYEDIILGL